MSKPLSEEMHKEFHAQYGYGNNTEEQFYAFLKNKGSSLNLEKLLKESSFHVRRLLLWFDLKNICKELGIQVTSTDTPYLFHLQKNANKISIFIMNSRVSPREYLKRLKEKNPKLIILHPRELLLKHKREILPFFLLKQLKNTPILCNNLLNIQSVSKEDTDTFIKNNSYQTFRREKLITHYI